MKVKLHKNERILNDFFDVDVATLQYEKYDGDFSETVRRYNLTRPEAAAVLLYLADEDKLLLVRQFRYADFQRSKRGWITEIVAGVLDGDELPLEGARRETIEETGYEIDTFEHIASVYSSPGICTEYVHIYLGRATKENLKHTGGGLDAEHEDIQLVKFSPDEVRAMLDRHAFEDAKTILALQYFLLHSAAGR